MKQHFPYLRQGGRILPLVDITLAWQKKRLTIRALVDSGASFSLFRAEVADYLGIPLERGKKLFLEGIGGRIAGFLHQVPLEAGGKNFKCKIVFSREIAISLNLLGRDNFFLPFLITFRERQQDLILES